jgi:hypothetical protein
MVASESGAVMSGCGVVKVLHHKHVLMIHPSEGPRRHRSLILTGSEVLSVVGLISKGVARGQQCKD